MDNQTSISEFLLQEFSSIREVQILHFLIFLVLYLSAVTGNLLIISAVAFNHRLHTPLYFFLTNLALQDLGQLSVIIPKSMINSLVNTRHISYPGCVAQVLFFVSFAGSDVSLLTVMAYDRYVAICNPLQYEMIMNRRACVQMMTIVWIIGFLYGMMHANFTFLATFCSNTVNRFFCEIPQLLKLYCPNPKQYQAETFAIFISILAVFGCFIFIIGTYVQIFKEVQKITSDKGREKAFSTCIPHLTVFSILVFTSVVAHLSPVFKIPAYMDFVFGTMYSIVPPTLNPVIYSLRNKDIKDALTKLLGLR